MSQLSTSPSEKKAESEKKLPKIQSIQELSQAVNAATDRFSVVGRNYAHIQIGEKPLFECTFEEIQKLANYDPESNTAINENVLLAGKAFRNETLTEAEKATFQDAAFMLLVKAVKELVEPISRLCNLPEFETHLQNCQFQDLFNFIGAIVNAHAKQEREAQAKEDNIITSTGTAAIDIIN